MDSHIRETFSNSAPPVSHVARHVRDTLKPRHTYFSTRTVNHLWYKMWNNYDERWLTRQKHAFEKIFKRHKAKGNGGEWEKAIVMKDIINCNVVFLISEITMGSICSTQSLSDRWDGIIFFSAPTQIQTLFFHPSFQLDVHMFMHPHTHTIHSFN